MGRYHTDKVSEQLQQIPNVQVTEITASSWTFRYASAQASVRVLPGCCGILLFYNISGKPTESLRLLKETVKAATKAEFGLVLLSLKANSDLAKRLATIEGWHASDFKNPRTKNQIQVWGYRTPEPKPKAPKRNKAEHPED